MSETKTGGGGFELDGKTQVFSSVDPGDEGEGPFPIDKGDIKVDKSPKDIGEKVKRTIGEYLSSSTKKANAYTLDKEQQETAITNPEGLPVPPATSPNTEQHKSAISYPAGDQPALRKSIDKFQDPSPTLQIKKGRGNSPFPDGNTLLKGDQLPQQGKQYVSAVLSNNRFSEASRALGTDVNIDHPGDDFNPILHHPRYGDVTGRRLAEVGSILSLRSSLELTAGDGLDPTSTGAEAAALLPSLNQLGTSRIDLITLEAKDVFESLPDEGPSNSSFSSIAPGGSWGALNNVHDVFSGINALGMLATASALTAGVLVIYEGLGFLLDLINVGAKSPATNSDGSLVKGRSDGRNNLRKDSFPPELPPDIGALLGIRPTVNPFKECLSAGTAAFFGADNKGGLIGKVVSGATSSLQNPGFNVVVARTIIRSVALVIDSLKDIGGNSIAVAQGILGVVDAIRKSRLLGVLNVFASLGDIVITDQNSRGSVDPNGVVSARNDFDSIPDDAFAANVRKNRLTGVNKLAWSNNRSPASYLIPDSSAALAFLVDGLGAPRNGFGLREDRARIFYRILSNQDIKLNGARIPYDGADGEVTVKSMERELDAEYVPFYFHDLRTNEIISFQAFITSLTDNFTVNSEETEAFGRVDNVIVYKNTKRSINLSFIIASTSKNDFDDMWKKVNKLTTLCYPQYTKGRTIQTEDGNYRFTQPFSQLMSASPLIRLRLGELFSSNYSRFALAKLFGATGGDMVLNGQSLDVQGSQALLSKFNERLTRMRETRDASAQWLLETDNIPTVKEEGVVKVALPSPPSFGGNGLSTSQTAPVFRAADLRFFTFRITSKLDGELVVVTPFIMTAQEIQDQFDAGSQIAANVVEHMSDRYANPDNARERVIGGKYVTNIRNLIPSYSTIKRVKNEIAQDAEVNQDALNELNDFMNPSKNSVVRAFQEVRGKGLAGMIESMNFDFYEDVTWETSLGDRAPKCMRITMSFKPIHDISPGIAASGENRAPIYSIGHDAHTNDKIGENR